MFIIFCLVSISLLIIYSKNKFFLASPAFLYVLLWLILGFLASLGLYDYYKIGKSTYIILTLGSIFFCFGFNFRFKLSKFHIQKKTTTILNQEVYTLILIVAIFFQLIFFYRSIILIISGTDFNNIRLAFGDIGLGVINNVIESVVYAFLVKPMIYVSLSQLAIHIVYKILIKRNLYLSLLLVMLFSIDLGRVNLLYFMIMYFLCYYIKLKRESARININKILKFLLVFLFVIFVFDYVSSLRSVDSGILKALYEYFITGLIQLEKRIEMFNLSNFNHTYFYSFFSGIFTIVFLFIKNIGISLPNLWNDYLEINSTINSFIHISNSTISNAFVTTYFYFYIDLSYFGIMLGSCIYGIISRNIFDKLKYCSYLYLANYLILMAGLLTSFVRWQFSLDRYVLAFLFVKLIYSPIKIQVYKEN